MLEYKHKDGMMTADMNGETVMMDIESGKYYNLGEVGGRIWELLDEPKTFDDLISALVGEYDVSRQQCEQETRPFFSQLLEAGLIVEA